MIIWRGLGILIIPVLALAMVLGMIIGTATGFQSAGFAVGFLFAAAMNWLLWKLIGPKPRPAGAPPPLQPHRRDSLFFIPAKAWTAIFALLVLPVSLLSYSAAKQEEKLAKTPGYNAFQAADRKIFSAGSTSAHGNHPKAVEAAETFSTKMRTLQEFAFTGGSKKPLLTKGDFLTYCHQGKNTVVFLCHVPDLRKYADPETKDLLVDLAWTVARTTAPTLGLENPEVMVGLRGATTYGFVLQGKASDENPVRVPGAVRASFYPIFAETPSEPAPDSSTVTSP